MTDRTNAFDPPDLPLRATLKRIERGTEQALLARHGPFRRRAPELSQPTRRIIPVRSARRDVAAAGT